MSKQADAVATQGSRRLQRALATGRIKLDTAASIVRRFPAKARQDAELASLVRSKMNHKMRALGGEIEWYTPRMWLDAVVRVLDNIDLDPASSLAAQQRVGADKFFTIQRDGLKQEWTGRVFLNPPYAMPTIRDFAAKMVGEWQCGRMHAGIMLTNAATDTAWFHALLDACNAVCFTRGRVRFLKSHNGDAGVQMAAPTVGQAFFYFGADVGRFSQVFGAYGAILHYHLPRRTAVPLAA